MLSRNIYIVRHGETILNAKEIRQGEEGSLSDKGKLQAKQAGERLAPFHIKKVFCSPFQRTRETCSIICNTLGLEESRVIYTPLLGERRNPSEIIGLNYNDATALHAVEFMDRSYHEESARWSDEENYIDLRDRARKLQSYLEENSVDKSLCITHGIFLKMFLSVLTHGDGLTIEKYVKLTTFNPADNAGITVLKYSPYKFFSKNKWEVLAYNDTTK